MPDPTTLPHLVRFGIYEVNLRAGELRRDGVKIKLQEQPFKVLAMLLERPGEIVTREELEKALWSTDTFVDFEHGVNKAINKIREALDDSADNPRFVETLARRGYRFIAPVDVGAGFKPAPGQVRDWLAAVAGGAIVVVVAVLLALNVGGVRDRILRRAATTKPSLLPLRAVPFTTFPGQETEPSFSPDGNQIAFAWNGEKEDNWDIYVKVVGTESVLRLTTNPAADGAPVWSPDGRYIAFHRHTEREDGIYLVPALGGPERKLYPPRLGGNRGVGLGGWSPDGKFLAFSEKIPGQELTRISVLSVETLDKRAVTSPPPSAFYGDWGPRYSPDGRTLAFLRSSASADEICLVPTAGGEPKRLTHDNSFIGGLTWTPDGAHVIYSSAREGGLWKISVAGGEAEQLPVGRENAILPALSRDGRRLAYVQASGNINIWRFEVLRGGGPRQATHQVDCLDRGPTGSAVLAGREEDCLWVVTLGQLLRDLGLRQRRV